MKKQKFTVTGFMGDKTPFIALVNTTSGLLEEALAKDILVGSDGLFVRDATIVAIMTGWAKPWKLEPWQLVKKDAPYKEISYSLYFNRNPMVETHQFIGA